MPPSPLVFTPPTLSLPRSRLTRAVKLSWTARTVPRVRPKLCNRLVIIIIIILYNYINWPLYFDTFILTWNLFFFFNSIIYSKLIFFLFICLQSIKIHKFPFKKNSKCVFVNNKLLLYVHVVFFGFLHEDYY